MVLVIDNMPGRLGGWYTHKGLVLAGRLGSLGALIEGLGSLETIAAATRLARPPG